MSEAPRRVLHSLLVLFLIPPALAGAQAPSQEQQLRDARAEVDRLRQEIATLKDQYDARLAALEQQLKMLGAPTPATAPQPQEPTAPAAPPPASAQSPSSQAKVFNPDIAVIGNFLGATGSNPNSDQPTFALDEVEASFQAAIDPYARGDVFLSASPEGLEVEEGFITFPSLPGGLLLKAGKMRAQFGKVNASHTHVLSWTDRPLVTENLVGGDEGISEAGFSVSRLLPTRAFFLEATGEIYYGRSSVFHSTSRADLVYVARLRGYHDITEAMNLDLGGSYAFGPSTLAPIVTPDGQLSNQLFGFDVTFRYRPLQRAIYRRFLARTELIWSQPKGDEAPGGTSFGWYGSGEYQFARRWFAGARYDRSARAFDSAVVDRGGSLFVTYWPSEFSQIRGQYRHTQYGDGVDANEFLFQFLFSIGAHGAHVF